MTGTKTEAVARPSRAPAAREKDMPTGQKSEPSSAPGQTLGGVLAPGGALTGLIGLCWLIHQFGLSAVILAVVACSAVATTALVVRARRRVQRGRPPQLARSTLPSPGRGHRTAAHPAGRMQARGKASAARSGTGTGTSRGAGASPAAAHRRGRISASRKPGGLASASKRPLTAVPNAAGGRPAPLGRNAAATGGTGRRSAPAAASPRTGRKPGGPAAAPRRGGASSMPGAAGRLARTLGRKTPTAPTGGRPITSGGKRQPGGIKGGYKAAPQPGAASATKRAAKAAKSIGKAVNRGRSGGQQPTTKRLKARPKPQVQPKKKSKPGSRKNRAAMGKHARRFGSRAPMSVLRRGRYWAGRKLRKHTSPLVRRRLRKAAVPFRAGARAVARYGSPLLANAWRLGSRGLLKAHMALGSVRFSTMGPNWLRPLARVLHTLTTPAARALAWTGTWGWLNRWMYRHTGGGSTPTAPRRPSAPGRRTAAVHRPVHSPTRVSTAPAVKGVPVSSIEPALPLHYAADAVRTAGAMMVLNPAGNMVGYEATINSLAEIQRAIGDVIAMAAHSSRENFKVNPAIPDAYDDTSVYAHALAGRLDSIPTLYRIIHAEQIDNIENPTVQGAKWDQSANN